MTKADKHPGDGQESVEARNVARINKAFELFDKLLPADHEWSSEGASVITITSNNPAVDGPEIDQKAATFDPKFAVTKTFFDDRHVPRKIELFKYKVHVPGEDGSTTEQFRRHFRVSRNDGTSPASDREGRSIAYVLHEPNATPTRSFPRRLEVGASSATYDANGALSAVDFEDMTITTGEELVQALSCLSRACGMDPEKEVSDLGLTNDEWALRRDRVRAVLAAQALRATASRRRTIRPTFTHEEADLSKPAVEPPRRSPALDDHL